MNSNRLFTPANKAHDEAAEYIDMYIEIYLKRCMERLFNGEEPFIIYKFLDLASANVSMAIYCEEIYAYYNQKDYKQYKEIKEIFIALGYLTHGTVEKNDLLMSSLRKANSAITIDGYNRLISERVCEFIVNDTLPRLKQHPDFHLRLSSSLLR